MVTHGSHKQLAALVNIRPTMSNSSICLSVKRAK